MMKILFAAAEAVPFAKTGGLGDVIGSLPKELRKQGLDVRVVLPKYQEIPDAFKERMVFRGEFSVPVGWRQQYCGVFELEHEGVPFYFIDNEYYFKRRGFYGYHDDAERFAFFSRAVLEVLPEVDFIPDVVHCHDWHTGMIPAFLDAHYRQVPGYETLRTVFTIHNLRYQGIFPKEIVPDILGLDWKYFNDGSIEFYDDVNFMKAGIAYADLVSTVSRTYAQEIQDPFFGEKLDGLLRARQDSLVGIVNGIDYDIYNPASDPHIAKPYNADDLSGKAQCKLSLQQRLGLPQRADVPIVAIVSRLVGPKGMDLVEFGINQLTKRANAEGRERYDMQIVVLGTGEARYENFFKYLAWQYPGKVSANIMFDDVLAHQAYAGADIFVMPSLYEPCGIGQLIAMRYGCLPLVRETGGLHDTVVPYNKYTGEGTGFTFSNYNAHEMIDALDRALDAYHDKDMWHKLQQNAMQMDYSWRESARQYQEMYERLRD